MFLVFLYFYFGSFIALMLNWRNPFIVLILLELQLLIIFYFFAYFSFVCYLIIGFVIALFVLSFAGAEASAGIAFLINFYRSRGVLTAKFPPALRSTLPFLVLSSDSFFFNYAYSSSLDAFYVKKSSDTFSLLDIDTFGCYSFLPSNFYICDGLMSDEVSLFTTLSLYLCLPVVEPMVSGFYWGSELKFLAYFIFDHFYVHLLILGFLFLVVIVGVISLLLNRNLHVRRQDIFSQHVADICESIFLVEKSKNQKKNK